MILNLFRNLAFVLLGLGALNLFAAENFAPPARPNILFILADDLGYKDTGYTGSDYYETPNIDRLAKSGMIFTDAYAAAGNCAPSRACLISGTYTPRHGVYAVGRTDRGPKKLQRVVAVPGKTGLVLTNFTMADALRAGGYATAIFGKWHLDGRDGHDPTEQGFDLYFDSRKENPNASTGEAQADPKGIFSNTDAALKFMETNVAAHKPFFAYLAYHAIHSKQEARQETIDYFKAKKKGTQHDNPLYAACTKDLDAAIGELLAKVDALGIASNTFVIFTSDNGGTQQSSQEPLRGNKGCYYEGGIREPFVVRWPGVVQPGTTSSVPVINVDLYPTFLALAGSTPPSHKILDGENLLPLLNGGALKRHSIFWDFPGYLDQPVIRGRDPVFRSRPVIAMRQGDWKLHLFLEEWQLDGGRAGLATNNAVELYNLRDDVGERHNLAQSNLSKRNELLDTMLAWIKTTAAPLPTAPNPNYDDTAQPPKNKRGKNKAVDNDE